MKLMLLILSLLVFDAFAQFGQAHHLISNTFGANVVRAADIDGDGMIDVVGASIDDEKLFWYKNYGGEFGGYISICNSCDYVADIHIVDIDNDADLDVLAASASDNKISLFVNLGNGVFASENIITTGAIGASSVSTGDIDNDGDLDVVSSSFSDNKVAWYENQGGLVFGSEQVITNVALETWSAKCFDFNGDNNLDVIASAADDNSIIWYENQGGGVFTSQHIVSDSASDVRSIQVVDINGDGEKDVLACMPSANKVIWLENGSNGVFIDEHTIGGVLGYPLDVFAMDSDNDGDQDVIVACSNSIVLIENTGAGVFASSINVSTSVSVAKSVYLEDIDNDGEMDALSASENDNKIAWYKGLGGNTFANQNLLSFNVNNPQRIQCLDVDFDQDLDVVFSSTSGMFIMLNNGVNLYDSSVFITNLNLNDFEVVDVDMDNDLDIVSQNGSQLVLFENLGNTTFSTIQNVGSLVWSSPSGFELRPADVDLDGDVDFFVTFSASFDDKLVVMENDGNGQFLLSKVISHDNGWIEGMTPADIDLDGDVDLFAAKADNDSIVWYENISNGQNWVIRTITTNVLKPQGLSSIDIDNDGDWDVIYGTEHDTLLAWHENDGQGNFGPQNIISNNEQWCNLVVTDVDQDGYYDIVAHSESNNSSQYGYGTLYWFKNMNGSSFGSANFITDEVPHSLPFEFLACHDLDDDGDPEVFIIPSLINELKYYFNHSLEGKYLTGRIYADVNQNGLNDSTDIGFNYVSVVSTPSSDYTTTFSNGNYFMSFTDTPGSYMLQPQSLQYWSVVSDSSTYTIVIDSNYQVLDSLDFGLYPDTLVEKIEANIVGGFPRCNSNVNYWISVSNKGTTIPSGIISLEYPSNLTFVSASVAPDSVVLNKVYWHYDSLLYFDNFQITAQLALPGAANIGQGMLFKLEETIIDSTGNQNLAASDSLSQVLVCAYDPNDKLVYPSGLPNEGYILDTTSQLEYTIRFQNTGNDTAINVIIKDQLSSNIDWTTFELISSSHNVQTIIDQTGLVTFNFNQIMLPDSNVDYNGSQGYVNYRVQLIPGLTAGDQIVNYADIFFDSNPPITTNNAVSTLYNCSDPIVNELSALNLCYDDTLNAVVELEPSPIVWTIQADTISTSESLYWEPDTSGNLELVISVENEFCTKDTAINLVVYDEIPLVLEDSLTICNTDSVMVYGNYVNMAGYYYNSYQSIFGCDSSFATIVNHYPHYGYIDDDSLTICAGDSILVYGNVAASTGLYFDSLSTVNGCDSVLVTHVQMQNLPMVELSAFSSDTICVESGSVILPSANLGGGTYSGDGVVSGMFDPQLSGLGTHTIVYTYTDGFSCTNSDSVLVTVESCLSIKEEAPLSIDIYPNPFSQIINLQVSYTDIELYYYAVYDISGRKLIGEKLIDDENISIDCSQLASGTYLLKISDSKGTVKQISRVSKLLFEP